MKRQKKIRRVMVVDKSVAVRNMLKIHYFKSIRPCLDARYDEDRVYQSAAIKEVKRKINAGIAPDMIIFSQDFPEADSDKLIEWMDERELAVTFVYVPLLLWVV